MPPPACLSLPNFDHSVQVRAGAPKAWLVNLKKLLEQNWLLCSKSRKSSREGLVCTRHWTMCLMHTGSSHPPPTLLSVLAVFSIDTWSKAQRRPHNRKQRGRGWTHLFQPQLSKVLSKWTLLLAASFIVTSEMMPCKETTFYTLSTSHRLTASIHIGHWNCQS